MVSYPAIVLCALTALVFWSGIGWIVARRLFFDRALRLAAAPALGWALQVVAGLLLSTLAQFSTWTVLVAGAAVCAASLVQPPETEGSAGAPLPWWVFAVAALVAVAPVLGLLPKSYPDGVALAAPIYDHSKIALVDEMLRSGAPPANPFFGQNGEAGRIAYYYLWLFGAAELGKLTGAGGWEADIAATWFTAFASLTLMCGLAFRFSKGRAAAVVFVLVACCGDSLRPVLAALFGQPTLDAVLKPGGLSNWLVQTSWSPHHVASASAVVLSLMVMERLSRRFSLGLALVLAVLAAAGFQSSVWVGGVAFALCAAAAALVLLLLAEPDRRLPFVAALCIAALLALAIVSPLLAEQVRSAASRAGGSPLAIEPFPVLGSAIPESARGPLDASAYWIVLLFVDFPALWIAGAVAAVGFLRSRERPRATPFAVAALASLVCGWLLASRAGENNDLGWRAILPALMILCPLAGAYVSRLLDRRERPAVFAIGAALCLSLPAGIGFAGNNARGDLAAESAAFRTAPAMWAAVRNHANRDERVASNPLMASSLTSWPVNISWALLADRRSCFAGNELAIAFAPLSADDRQAASGLFERVFAGIGTEADVATLVSAFGCGVALLTAEDGAWTRDPFARSRLFELAETDGDRWRVYRLVPGAD